MGTTFIIMLGYLRTPQEYRDANKILQTLSAVAEQGYLITTPQEASSIVRQKGYYKPGISPTLYPFLQDYLSGTIPYLHTQACFVAQTAFLSGFTYGCLSLSQEDQMFTIDVDDWHFTLHGNARDDSRYPIWKNQTQALYNHWIEMLQLVYRIWHPLYLYDFSSVASGLWPETNVEDTRALRIKHLYEHNLFGPELVETIGRERMLHVPAWRTSCLDDGGVMIIPNDLYIEPSQDNMVDVAQALHLPYDTYAIERWIRKRLGK